MKAIFSLIISGALVVSGLSQTRNVLVGTNDAVVQPTNFWSADASNARTGLGLGTAATNPASAFQPSSAVLSNLASSNGGDLTNIQTANLFGVGTNPVLVDTNGSVITPSNFWQAAPIATTLQNSFPTTNSTNAANSARLLFLFSLAPSTVGVTNTITLPTNGNTFNGDVATITHSGPTSSVTAIRQLGASTNIITLNQVDESVRFIYRNNQWTLMDNISYIEPIYFSGTSAAANAAASRTNLGGTTVGNAVFTATNAAAARNAIGLGASNDVVFNELELNGVGLLVDESAFFNLNINTNYSGIKFASGGTPMFTVTGTSATFSTNVTVNGILKASDSTATPATNAAAAQGIQWESLGGSQHAAIYGGYAGAAQIGLAVGTSNSLSDVATFNSNGVTVSSNLNVGGAINVTNKAETRTNLGLGAARLVPTTTNITTSASITLDSVRALEATVDLFGGGWTTNVITLPTNNPQHNDLVNIIFKKGSGSIIVTNAGGLGGPWYVNSKSVASWIYDTNGGPARWQSLGRTIESDINYLGTTAGATRTNLGLGGGITTNLVLKNGANVDTYMNFSNGILIYGSTTPP